MKFVVHTLQTLQGVCTYESQYLIKVTNRLRLARLRIPIQDDLVVLETNTWIKHIDDKKFCNTIRREIVRLHCLPPYLYKHLWIGMNISEHVSISLNISLLKIFRPPVRLCIYLPAWSIHLFISLLVCINLKTHSE